MPDWVHSLLYILILVVTMFTVFFFMRDVIGLIIGLLAGHTAASFIVSRLPGFWGDRKH